MWTRLLLAETGQSLGRSLTDLLDVEGPDPTLELKPRSRPHRLRTRKAARARACTRRPDAMADDLADAPWWSDAVAGPRPRARSHRAGRRLRPLA